MEHRNTRDLQYLGLPTVCAVVYASLTGVTPDPRDPEEMQRILNDVAHALSNLVPIWWVDAESGIPQALTAFELIGGTFIRGAHVFRTKTGKEIAGLTVQRIDMTNAISILRGAHISFRRPLIG